MFARRVAVLWSVREAPTVTNTQKWWNYALRVPIYFSLIVIILFLRKKRILFTIRYVCHQQLKKSMIGRICVHIFMRFSDQCWVQFDYSSSSEALFLAQCLIRICWSIFSFVILVYPCLRFLKLHLSSSLDGGEILSNFRSSVIFLLIYRNVHIAFARPSNKLDHFGQSHSISCTWVDELRPETEFQLETVQCCPDTPVRTTIPCCCAPNLASNRVSHHSSRKERLQMSHSIQRRPSTIHSWSADACTSRDPWSIPERAVSTAPRTAAA